MIDGEAKDLIIKSRAGKCVKPEDVNGMIKILKRIIKNKNQILLNRSKINTRYMLINISIGLIYLQD